MSFLIAGLGNIGAEYAGTRHNIGFCVLDALAKASNSAFSILRYGSLAEVAFKGKPVLLLKPSTYMNLSGKAVNYWLRETRTPLDHLLVVLDDLALPLGVIRMRKQGSDGGHNGLKSINETLGTTAYTRLRVGIGSNFGRGQQVDYVLGAWDNDEVAALPFIMDKCRGAVEAFVTQGPDRAMTLFNATENDTGTAS
ncbi:MAG: aminoacyl-tRNA hydrolase [Bacteroidetes bacterium]|nr:aminoacyl-tRNA hydrolase [Bacteroidota bacterium]